MSCLFNKSIIVPLKGFCFDLPGYLFSLGYQERFSIVSFTNCGTYLLQLDTLYYFNLDPITKFFLYGAMPQSFNDGSCHNSIRTSSFCSFCSPKLVCFAVRLYLVTTRSFLVFRGLTPAVQDFSML